MSGGRRGPVVTLDGPAGAGKTTTAKEVARRLGLRHLDSGALYRALTFGLLQAGVPEARWPALDVDELRALGVKLEGTAAGYRVIVGGRPVDAELRTPEVTSRVSRLARLPAARACLLELQRTAGAEGGLVADGRDMGTVVFPEADVKVFLIADLRERARRRLLQDRRALDAEAIAAEAEAIRRRDEQDSERDISPLRRPEGALEIDTTAMSFEDQVDAIVRRVGRLTL